MTRKINSNNDRQSRGDGSQMDVGYGRPPAHTRFQPGKSGNPGGRPKGSRNKPAVPDKTGLFDFLLAESQRDIIVHDGGEVISMPMAQAIIRTLAVNAAKGQPRAQKLFLDNLKAAEADRRARHEDYLKTAIDYKTSKEAELAYLEKTKQDASHILPHPDDVVINMQTGEVEIRGPMTREDQAVWRNLRASEKQARANMMRYISQLEDPTLAEQHSEIRASANAEVQLASQINQAIGNWDR